MGASSLADQKAAVVGAGTIGSAIALALAEAGADVGLTYAHRSEAARALEMKIATETSRRATSTQCDVTSAESTARALASIRDTFGGLDIVVSAIGTDASWKSIVDVDPAEWARYIAIDLTGNFHILQAAARLLRGRGGAIVVLSSIAASLCQSRGGQNAAAKSGVEALVRVLAREEGRNNIRVNAVAVGLTASPATDATFASWGPEASARVVKGIPMRRIGDPAEIADVVTFLAGPGGRYVTGKVLGVDGGQHIGH
jgi:3-oxoacyl-[acyl-carrier protein] reductase